MLLRRRLVLLFAGILAGVLILSVAAGAVIARRDDTRTTERRLAIAQEQSAQLAAAYSDQETGARGFVLSGDERFLEPFNSGTDRAERLTRSLRGIAAHEHALRQPLHRAVAASETWRTMSALRAIAEQRSGDSAGAALVVTGQGKEHFDTLRARLATLTRRVDELSAQAEADSSDARLSLTLLIVLVVAFAVAGTLLASWLIRRWVTRPLDDLGEQVRRTRAGESQQPIRTSGPPEIAELGADVDAMRSRIEEQRADAERSRTAVEQSAAVLLTLRAHLEPQVGPLPRGWTLAAQLRAAEGVVAGDCYDLVFLEQDRIGLVVVDIAGHGAIEGILALRCKELLRAALASDLEPGDAIATAGDQLGELGEEVFLTAFTGVIDTRTGRIRYANAGHPPAFIAASDEVIELNPTGPLVGLLRREWRTAEATIGPADTLCVYTDGLIEVRNDEHEFFGPERLVELVQGARSDEAAAIVKRCLDEVQIFAPRGLRDDATIVVVCRPDID
jgi:serine phosphatase RsbU (regulator of sigma subunit)/CHASE3 domain sensor protein